MKTIRRSMLLPLLSLIIGIPVVTMLLFNGALRIYVRNTAQADLKNTAETMGPMIKKQLATELAADGNTDTLREALASLRPVLKSSTLALHTELLVVGPKGTLLYPRNTGDSELTDLQLQRFAAMASGLSIGEIQTVRAGLARFLVLREAVNNKDFKRQVALVYVSPLGGANGLIATVNLLLGGILTVGILVGLWVTLTLARRIERPLKELRDVTEGIGAGEFAQAKRRTDILELRQLQSSVSDMSARLAAYDSAQRIFLQNASHELRTPLMSIQGYSEGLQKGILPDVGAAAAVINAESRRLNALVDELLTLSRLQTKTYERHMEPVDLREALQDMAQRLQGAAMKENKAVTLDLPQGPVPVKADENLLSQAVGNIASNGLRYARQTVTLRLRMAGGRARVEITDDGEGIDPAALPHLFERFYKGAKGNYGLGLAIAKSAVELMGGTVAAGNGEAGGAVFTIDLPLA